MHRVSASENPSAPLAHHLQDSTHISMGVLTTGFTYRWLKVEGSAFNGREPDDKRYNLEFNPWNSRSFRVTVAPNRNWAMQYSYGLLKNPEFFEPGDTHRQTASVQYNRPFERGNFAAAFIWGRNRESHDGETFRLNGYTAEATVNFRERNYVYTRLELVDREGDDLLTHDEFHDLGFDGGRAPAVPRRRLHLRRGARAVEHGPLVNRARRRRDLLHEARRARRALRSQPHLV